MTIVSFDNVIHQFFYYIPVVPYYVYIIYHLNDLFLCYYVLY